MKTALVVLGCALGAFFLLGVSLGLGYIGFTNDANKQEIGIQSQYSENQNVYDNGWKKVQEVAQIPTMQVDKMKEVYLGAIQGRYGANGSQAMFQAMHEADIKIDQTTFVKIQQVIEEFRNAFQNRQSEMVARVQTYRTFLEATTSGRLYNMVAGYPRIDLNKYGTLVTSEQTQSTFATKKADELQIYKSKK